MHKVIAGVQSTNKTTRLIKEGVKELAKGKQVAFFGSNFNPMELEQAVTNELETNHKEFKENVQVVLMQSRKLTTEYIDAFEQKLEQRKTEVLLIDDMHLLEENEVKAFLERLKGKLQIIVAIRTMKEVTTKEEFAKLGNFNLHFRNILELSDEHTEFIFTQPVNGQDKQGIKEAQPIQVAM